MLDGELTQSFVETPSSQIDGFTLEQAYAEQDSYIRAQEEAGRQVIGYKVAYARPSAQVRVGLDSPVYGQLLEGMAVSDGASVVASGFRRFVIEAEIAISIGTTIDKPIGSVEELMPYIDAVHPALEMPDALYGYSVVPQGVDMVAANTSAYRYALGRGIEPVGFDPGEFVCTLRIGNRSHSQGRAGSEGTGPYDAVLWLVQELQSKGKTLDAGQIILTGAPARPYLQPNPSVNIAGRYTCDCGALGKVSVVLR